MDDIVSLPAPPFLPPAPSAAAGPGSKDVSNKGTSDQLEQKYGISYVNFYLERKLDLCVLHRVGFVPILRS